MRNDDAPNRTEAELPGTRRLRVLLVDDDPDSGMALARLLALRGHQVEVATSLEQALAVQPRQLDLLITDVELQDGSGLDLPRKLGTATPFAAIVLSGHGSDEDIQRSRDAGFREHLVKPVDFKMLLEAIARAVPQGAAARAGR